MEENGQEMPQQVDENENAQTQAKPKPPCHTSHFRNVEQNSIWLRYGLVIYLLGTLALLLASDIGSGVAAEYILIQPSGQVFEQESLFEASIFTSVKELWDTGSYALVILIVITSIMWPYIKLLLSLFSWMTPYRKPRRRERLLEVIDALGKWSFIDIFVLLIIMVSFRSTIQLNAGVTMEVVVVPRVSCRTWCMLCKSMTRCSFFHHSGDSLALLRPPCCLLSVHTLFYTSIEN